MEENKCNCFPCQERKKEQRHDHEVLGVVMIAEKKEDPHNHHFSTVSGEAIYVDCGKNHFHEIEFRTDFYEEHYHTFKGKSGKAIDVGGDRHIHFAEAETSYDDGHNHQFKVAALIENPIGKRG